MNCAGAEFAGITKLMVVLATSPVAAAPVFELGVGRFTTNGVGCGCDVPAPSYRVATPDPLSAIQNGAPRKNAIPHAFLRLSSVVVEPD